MPRFLSPTLGLLVTALLLTVGCNGEEGPTGVNGTDQPLELFPSQTYTEDFDTGTPGARWNCGSGGCQWQVVRAGPLTPEHETASATAGPDNFVFQSPDPQALDPNRGGQCESFNARFTQAGTFGFNYFVQTAGPVGPIRGNELEVTVVRHTLEFDPEFEEEVIVASDRTTVLTMSGTVSSRFSIPLPPAPYSFEFCYLRNRTTTGPDFVQVDNVQTCVGTGCAGLAPTVRRCRVDQGQTLVEDLSRLPIPTFTINRVQGQSSRYYLIIDTDFLEFITGGLATASPKFDAFKAEVDSILSVTLVDGKTCDIDRRRSLYIEMSTSEIVFMVLETGIITDALKELELALIRAGAQAAFDAAVQAAVDKVKEKILEYLLRFIIRALVK